MHVVPGLVAEVLVVAAGVLVRDQAIHRRGEPGPDDEARQDQDEAPEVKTRPRR